MVRKNTTRIDSFLRLQSKDGKKVIVKPVCIAYGKITKSAATAVREEIAKAFDEEVSKSDFERFMTSVVSKKILYAIKKRLHKLNPVKEVAVRSMKLVDLPTSSRGKVVVTNETEDKEDTKEVVKESEGEAKAETKEEVAKEEKSQEEKSPEEAQ
jgi:ribosomal protein S3AE